MHHQLLQNINSLDSEMLAKLFKEYDFYHGAIYRVSNKGLTLLVASDDNAISWPASTPFNFNYTTNFSSRLPVGWVKPSTKLKGSKIWPPGINFYYPVQNNFEHQIMFAIKPVNSRVKTGALNVALEVLSARIHHIMSTNESTCFVSETVYQTVLKEQANKLKDELHSLQFDRIPQLRGVIDEFDQHLEENDFLEDSMKVFSGVTNSLELFYEHLVANVENLKKRCEEEFAVRRGEKEKGNFDLREITLDAVEQAEIEGGGSVSVKAVVGVKGSLICNGIAEQFKDAIKEVCKNSLLYSARTHVEISVYESGEMYVVDVGDDGPGVKEGLENIIFLKYYRKETIKSLNKTSLGLGLDFARSVALAHRGDLTHIRTSSGRSIFRFLIPKEIKSPNPDSDIAI